MANRLYDKGRNAFARGEVVWKAAGGSTIRLFLVDSALYTPDFVNDEFLTSIPAAARKGDNGNTAYNQGALMTLLDPTAGVCDANDTTILAVPAAVLEFVVIYKQGTADGDSQLIAYIDTAINLPVTTAGSDVLVSWDNGANKIFKL